MLIEVTQEDIALGDRNEPRSCPVARAIQRTVGYSVSVGGWVEIGADGEIADHTEWTVRRGHGGVHLPVIGTLPERVADAISEYDDGYGMDPFSFTLILT